MLKLLFRILVIALAYLSISAPAQAEAKTIGVIITYQETFAEVAHRAFMDRLSEKGYGDKLQFIVQRPHPDTIAWINSSRKLVAADVDVIVTYGAAATNAALKQHSNIPILFANVYEPLADKLRSKDSAGVCSKYSISSILRYLRSASSGKNVGVMYCEQEDDSRYQYEEILDLAKKYDMNITSLNVNNAADTVGMISDINITSILITSSSLVRSAFPTVMRIAESRKIPVASLLYHSSQFPVMMLSADPQEQGVELAEKLIKVLSGIKVEKIPTTCSEKIDLVFNVREAQKIGMRIPMDLVTEATRLEY